MSASIWGSTVDLPHIAPEECLPVIGGCQVSSILSTLEENVPLKPVSQSLSTLQDIPPIILQHDSFNKKFSENNGQFEIANDSSGNAILNLTKAEPTKNFTTTVNRNGITFVNCGLCPFLCLNEQRISEHMEVAHKNGATTPTVQYNCPTCTNLFYHIKSLEVHLLYDHNVSEYDLNTILQVCTMNNSVENEIIDYENEKINSPLTPKDDNECLIPIEHVNIPKADSAIILPTVDLSENHTEKLFNNYIKQPDHISMLIGSKMFHKCPMCKVRMQDSEKMKFHIRCHKDSYFKCPKCNTPFPFWNPLTGHLWRLHKIDMELYSCDLCEYKTCSLARLNNIHKPIHNEHKSYLCELCKKAFKNIKQLRNHRSTHKKKTENTVLACEICSKNFYERRQLRIHMDSVHKKLKPYVCNFCGYKAGTNSTLKMHVRQHTGEKPFSCDSCEYTTSDHNSLRRHKLRHTGQKPYKCTHCDYACIQSSTFKVHLKRKHPGVEKELLFSCTDCSFKSINKEVFCTHVKTAHAKNVSTD